MGDPKKPRKQYSGPRNPWDKRQADVDLNLIGVYGLRNKTELWKLQTKLSEIRKRVRDIISTKIISEKTNENLLEETNFLNSLKNRGLISADATIDDVLSLSLEDLLERRLQTIVWKKGLTVSPYQSRQIITHGHIAINDKIVTIPSYQVKKDEINNIVISSKSSFVMNQANPAEDVKPVEEAKPAEDANNNSVKGE